MAGPYTSINCTLTLVSSKIRFDPGTSGADGRRRRRQLAQYPEQPGNQDPRFLYNFGATEAIATSHAQNDSGVFAVNFRDERYLPFETAGAISRWMISMPPAMQRIRLHQITDVVFKLSYTARDGGDLLRSQALEAAAVPPAPGSRPPRPAWRRQRRRPGPGCSA